MRWPASSHVFEGKAARGAGAPGLNDLAASAAESVADQRFLPRHSTACQSVDRCDGVKPTPSAASGGIRIIVLGWKSLYLIGAAPVFSSDGATFAWLPLGAMHRGDAFLPHPGWRPALGKDVSSLAFAN